MFEYHRAFSGFSVDDITKAAQFYGETLGIPLTENNGTFQLHLPGDRDTFVYSKPDHVPATYTIINFCVADIESAVDELAGRGVNFEILDSADEKGINRHGGPPIAWFKDPAGNWLSVLQEDVAPTG